LIFHLNSEKIIDVERLKSIEGIEQIDKYRDYTNNFTDPAKLKPEEILYLNLCDWLEPQAIKINAALKKRGGIKVIDPVSKAEVIIEKYDLYHSLLGEMKPEFLNNVTKGGHLPIAELKSALFETGEIKSLGNGFFDMTIKRGSNKRLKSYFPLGTNIEEAVVMIEEAILNEEFVKYIKPENLSIEKALKTTEKTFEVVHKINQKFSIHINNGIAKFYPNAL